MGLAAISGLDTQKFYDSLRRDPSTGKTPIGWSWMLENRGPRMLSTTPPLASATLIINKDVGIIRDEEVRLHIELPLLNFASGIITEVMKTHSSADDSCIVQYYLGFGSDRENLVVKQMGSSDIAPDEQDTLICNIATAHAVIHLVSAHETIHFAQALDLMRPEQKKQWFAIISGAAGGSTIFSEVIPRAFEDADGIEAAFKKYAKAEFAGDVVDKTSAIVEAAKKQGYVPKLLEQALESLKMLLA